MFLHGEFHTNELFKNKSFKNVVLEKLLVEFSYLIKNNCSVYIDHKYKKGTKKKLMNSIHAHKKN